MTQNSSLHYHLNWAKERIDEMDAGVASLEAKAGDVQADLRDKAKHALADLSEKRDAFKGLVKKQEGANEAAWNSTEAQMETDWTRYEVDMRKYVESFGDQAKQQQATFKLQADAQLKAWRAAADHFQAAGTHFATERRAEIDATVARMKEEATVAAAKLQKLQGAGAESWTVLMAGLTETRAALDHAYHAAREAFKKANAD